MSSIREKQQPSPYAEKPWLKHYDYWVPEQTNFARQPVHQMLNLAAAQFPDRPATVFLDAQLTFSAVKERAEQAGDGAFARGHTQGRSSWDHAAELPAVLNQLLCDRPAWRNRYKRESDMPKSAVGKVLRRELKEAEDAKQ